MSARFLRHATAGPVPAVFLVVLLSLVAGAATAAWSTNPAVNNAVCTKSGSQTAPCIVTDGAGGAIIAWFEGFSVSAQHVTAAGVNQWGTDGRLLFNTQAYAEIHPMLVTDGAGGAIFVAIVGDGITSHVFAQRVDAAGNVLWGAQGAAVCTAGGSQYNADVAADGQGGAVIAWSDDRNGIATDIYAQRINASGATLWAAGGVPVCTAADYQGGARVVADGAGGAIVAWSEGRNGNADIYARRVDASGAALWAADGVPVCAQPDEQSSFVVTSDGQGGAIVAWQDARAGYYDVYAQRVGAGGVTAWTADGLPVCTTPPHQQNLAIAGDGQGGAVIAWMTWENNAGDIYAQRVLAAGTTDWTTNGVAVCTATGTQGTPAVIAAAGGSFVVAWTDGRVAASDIYAQKLSTGGAAQWTVDGAPVATRTGAQSAPALVAASSGGIIVTWQHSGGSSADIYASRVNPSGALGDAVAAAPGMPSAAHGLRNQPNPFNPSTTISYELPAAADVTLRVFDARGREVATLARGVMSAGRHALAWNAAACPSGLYLCRLEARPLGAGGAPTTDVTTMVLVK